jgi:ligand-binding sensor domain-containing protein/signal transduction histidine kinase
MQIARDFIHFLLLGVEIAFPLWLVSPSVMAATGIAANAPGQTARAAEIADAGSAVSALQYSARAWQTDEGLPHNLVRAITQTPDGYLWVGTRAGLARFDGLRFTRFDGRNTPALKNSNISALCVDRSGALWIGTFGAGLLQLTDRTFKELGTTEGLVGSEVTALEAGNEGSLWIGTTTGLSRYRDGKFFNYTCKEGLASEIIRCVREDRSGNVWIATGEGLNRFRDGVLDSFTTTNGLPNNSVRGLYQDRRGRLWIGSDGGLLCYERGIFRPCGSDDELTDTFVNAACEDGQGTLWLGTYSGLNRFSNGRIINESNNEGVSYDLVNTLFVDREGTLWVGSREGLARLTPNRFLTYSRQQGLAHNNIMSVLEDRMGRIWVGTWGGGLNQLDGGKVTVLSTRTGFPYNLILSVCEGRDGSLWVGADYDGGLMRLEPGKLTRYAHHDGLINAAVRVLHEDRSGNLWIGTSRGLSCLREGRFTTYTVKDGLADDTIRAICEDHEGRLWFGTEGGLNCRQGNRFAKFTVQDGLSDNVVLALYEDSRHDLWIGTEQGLNRRHEGKFSHYTRRQGLFSNQVLEILEDNFGYLWMSSLTGISRVSKQDLDALDRHEVASVHCTPYGRLDGLLSAQCNGVSKPAGWKSRDGRLWFPTTKGLVAVDPQLKVNELVPPVVIEEILADGKPLNPDHPDEHSSIRPLTGPAGRSEIEIHYTALSLQTPEKDRFKYKLEGVDPDWVQADTRRVAYYNHLHSGHYRFLVMACNNDGLWNPKEASLTLELLPRFWQTDWFLGLSGLTLLGGLAGSIRYLSLKRLRRRLAALEQQHAVEKERARIAKDIHDDLGASLTQITLLSDRLESETADELRANTRKISATAREMAQSLDEIVWAVNPQHDTVEGLIEYLSQSADEFLEDSPIRSRLKLPTKLPVCPIPAEVRHQLFLAFKEALNNAVKHASASEIQIEFVAETTRFQISIIDNGRGFDPAAPLTRGNGLLNMRKRLEALRGSFELFSAPNRGTEIKMTIPLSSNGH